MPAQPSNRRSDADLRRDLFATNARDRTVTVDLLDLIADFDARRLFVPDGYSTMHAFCVGELRMCENAAYKRIQAARAGWKHPQLLVALAEGRLHLTALYLLAPHLTLENVDELITASTHQTTRAIRDLIALRVMGPPPVLPFETLSKASALESLPVNSCMKATPQQDVAASVPRPFRVGVHCTVDRDKLDRARAQVRHSVPSGNLDAVFDLALDALSREMERRTFGRTKRPRERGRADQRPSSDGRKVPAHVKREVAKRDGDRCSFVGAHGHRCGERRFLQFDHIRPVALGGESTAGNLRLRCRAHNQYEAERVFGKEFMAEKREAAPRERERAHERKDRIRPIVSGLRNLGCRADEARGAAEAAVETASPGATLEELLRTALRSLAPPRSTRREESLGASAEPVAEPVAAAN